MVQAKEDLSELVLVLVANRVLRLQVVVANASVDGGTLAERIGVNQTDTVEVGLLIKSPITPFSIRTGDVLGVSVEHASLEATARQLEESAEASSVAFFDGEVLVTLSVEVVFIDETKGGQVLAVLSAKEGLDGAKVVVTTKAHRVAILALAVFRIFRHFRVNH